MQRHAVALYGVDAQPRLMQAVAQSLSPAQAGRHQQDLLRMEFVGLAVGAFQEMVGRDQVLAERLIAAAALVHHGGFHLIGRHRRQADGAVRHVEAGQAQTEPVGLGMMGALEAFHGVLDQAQAFRVVGRLGERLAIFDVAQWLNRIGPLAPSNANRTAFSAWSRGRFPRHFGRRGGEPSSPPGPACPYRPTATGSSDRGPGPGPAMPARRPRRTNRGVRERPANC